MTGAKEAEYYGLDRAELYAFASRAGVRLRAPALNVGCGAGRDASLLRDLGATEVHGVEPVAEAADQALNSYDRVEVCSVDEWDSEGRRFGLLVFADVLEHLAHPGAVLSRAHDWLTPEGCVLVSIPNVRHVSVLWNLVIRGEWRYEAEGILDETHLRFFTSRSFRRLLDECGYECALLERFGRHRVGRAVSRLVPGAGELLLSQVFAVARPARGG